MPQTLGLPSTKSYSNVRIQKGTVKGRPVVGSDMPATLLSNPSLGDRPPIKDSPFVRQYDGLKNSPRQDDFIIMGGHRRKRSLRMKMLLDKSDRAGLKSELVIPHDYSETLQIKNSVANTTEVEDMERSNSFGIGFFNGGAGNPYGGGACCGGGWGGGGWGGSGWGSGWGGAGGWGGWGGGWGGNGWGSGGLGGGCCGGYYG